MKLFLLCIQTLCIVALAPLVSGVIRKLKNAVRLRRGPGVLQPYYNLAKLLAKDEVVSDTASWIFGVTPYIVLASAVAALFLVPLALPRLSAGLPGDFLLVLFILALGRFFLALAGLDAGSAFGGMGSSREVFISGLAEPAAVLAAFAACFRHGTTSLAALAQGTPFNFASLVAAAALFLVALAETSRIPVDNQETHLELTMVHEAMVLEYSGRSLALLELAAHVKQVLFFALISLLILPPGTVGGSNAALIAAVFFAKIGVLAGIVACVEVSVAKMRLFRVVDFLSFAFILSGVAVVMSAVGL